MATAGLTVFTQLSFTVPDHFTIWGNKHRAEPQCYQQPDQAVSPVNSPVSRHWIRQKWDFSTPKTWLVCIGRHLKKSPTFSWYISHCHPPPPAPQHQHHHPFHSSLAELISALCLLFLVWDQGSVKRESQSCCTATSKSEFLLRASYEIHRRQDTTATVTSLSANIHIQSGKISFVIPRHYHVSPAPCTTGDLFNDICNVAIIWWRQHDIPPSDPRLPCKQWALIPSLIPGWPVIKMWNLGPG